MFSSSSITERSRGSSRWYSASSAPRDRFTNARRSPTRRSSPIAVAFCSMLTAEANSGSVAVKRFSGPLRNSSS